MCTIYSTDFLLYSGGELLSHGVQELIIINLLALVNGLQVNSDHGHEYSVQGVLGQLELVLLQDLSQLLNLDGPRLPRVVLVKLLSQVDFLQYDLT
ncbi:MAG: hypothetical protein ACMG6E_07075 [Candidatus Roizmanbacteria bacterium]